ncbi:hypothetical protein J7M28_09690 [bacterium]|nr:hypothetical protein [bacterium]
MADAHAKRTAIDRPCVVTVEGKTDRKFFTWMAIKLGLDHYIQVWPYDGNKQLKTKLAALATTSGFAQVTSLGIVMDADDHPDRAYQRICGALHSANLSKSREEPIQVDDGPRIQVLVLPSLDKQGALETVCLESVQNDPLMPCIEKFSNCVGKEWTEQLKRKEDESELLIARLDKMRVHAFLATRYDNPEFRLGEAAEADIWPFEHEAFMGIKAFLTQLCGEIK